MNFGQKRGIVLKEHKWPQGKVWLCFWNGERKHAKRTTHSSVSTNHPCGRLCFQAAHPAMEVRVQGVYEGLPYERKEEEAWLSRGRNWTDMQVPWSFWQSGKELCKEYRVSELRQKWLSIYTPAWLSHWAQADLRREWSSDKAALSGWGWPWRSCQMEDVCWPHCSQLGSKPFLKGRSGWYISMSATVLLQNDEQFCSPNI